MTLLSTAARLLWSPGVVPLFASAGVYCTVKTGFPQLRPSRWVPRLRERGGAGGLPPWKAAVTAIGGTLGTGNISGVAWAVALGGPGALFWMWAAAFLGMALSYCEKYLTIGTRTRGRPGGAMTYIERALGPAAGRFYAAALIASVFTGGCAVQSSAIGGSVSAVTGLPRLPIAILLTIAAYLSASGGLRRASDIVTGLVPLVAALYLGAGVYTLYMLRSELPRVMGDILKGAFSLRAGASGFAALRYGYARGVFSSDAGTGSSTVPHGASSARDPAVQGAWGIFEVLFGSLFICTVTALVILAGPFARSPLRGEELTAAAFSVSLGPLAAPFTALCVFILAFSTVVSRRWCAEQCFAYLGTDGKTPSSVLFLLSIFAGTLLPGSALWELADVLMALISIPDLIALMKLPVPGLPRLQRNE